MTLSGTFSSHGTGGGNPSFPIAIETPRLELREISQADADAFFALTTKPGFYYYCFDGTRAKVDAFIQEAIRTQSINPATGLRDNHMLAVVDKATGEIAGHVCLERVSYIPNVSYETNFFIDPAHQGNGFGFEAMANLMVHGFEKLGMPSYSATIHPNNGPSLAVSRGMGYRKIADITIQTVKGTEPRELLLLDKADFYNKVRNFKRPLFLDTSFLSTTTPAPQAPPQPKGP